MSDRRTRSTDVLVLSTYRALFRAPGTAAFSGAGFLARMPISMLGLGTVLMVSATTGTYAIAGVLSGAMALAGSIVGPQISRLIDRRGQARTLRPVLAAHGICLALLVAAVRAEWPIWTWFVAGMAAGATLPSIGSMVRARWTALLHDPTERQTAFAFESVVDEVVFVLGPVLATFLATSVRPEAGLLAALAFALVGGFWFASLRRTEPPTHPEGSVVPRREVLTRGLIAVCVTFVAVGTVFGSVEVVVVAFADERGQRGLSGLVLACYAAGSLLSGLVYGVRRWRRPLAQRFVLAAGFFGLVTLLPLAAQDLAVLAPLVFLTGLAIAPVLITGVSLVERLVPRTALTEGLTWSTTAVTFGVTVGAALAGPLVDAYGAAVAFRLPAVAAVLTAILALASRSWLTPRAAVESAAEAELSGARAYGTTDSHGTPADCPVPGVTAHDLRGSQGRMDP
jgi:predicted MFS family arabinose efflux permease